jgi:hypothetical protein
MGGNVHVVQYVGRVGGHSCRFNGEKRRIQRPKGSIPTRRQKGQSESAVDKLVQHRSGGLPKSNRNPS